MTSFASLTFPILLLICNLLPGQTRTHQNFDRNWKFAFGHAHNPEKDFNYGLETVFAKSGGASNTAIEPRFKDSLWRSLNLPHDWAVELPFVHDAAFNVMAHGYKPLGGNYPKYNLTGCFAMRSFGSMDFTSGITKAATSAWHTISRIFFDSMAKTCS